MHYTRSRHILSAILYVVVLFFVLWANNLFINWALHHVIMPFFAWFYDRGFIVKLLIVVATGSFLALLIFGVFMWIAEMISRLMAYIFIFNKASYYLSILMVLMNFVFSAIDMWKFIEWDFWIIIMWILIFYFVFQMNWTFVMQDKEKLEIEMAKAEAEANHNKLYAKD